MRINDGTSHVSLPNIPHFTHDGIIQYWLDYHGPFAPEHTPPKVGLRYRQFHTDENATKDLLAATGVVIGDFDGAAECYYLNADAVGDLMGRAEIVDEATEDEKEFVDHERCRSEEHTSELQSLMRNSSAVFCLYKKKTQKY